MGILPISPGQAIGLGIAAQALGSSAASAFSELLRSAADLLSPSLDAGAKTDAPPGAATASRLPVSSGTNCGGTSDLSVLGGQITALLSQIADRVRQVFTAGSLSIPPQGLTIAGNNDGNIALAGNGQDGSYASALLQSDSLLSSLFRALSARAQLFHSAASPGGNPGPVQVRVDAAGAAVV